MSNDKNQGFTHEKVEKNVALMAVLITIAVSFGGLAQIVPLMFEAEAVDPLPGVKPYPALELAGRDVYIREGCYNCHSQMIRPLRGDTLRYGPFSKAGMFDSGTRSRGFNRWMRCHSSLYLPPTRARSGPVRLLPHWKGWS